MHPRPGEEVFRGADHPPVAEPVSGLSVVMGVPHVHLCHAVVIGQPASSRHGGNVVAVTPDSSRRRGAGGGGAMVLPSSSSPAPLPAPQAVLGPDEVNVDEEEEDEAAQEQVDVEQLVIAVRDVVRDHLGHGEGEAEDDENFAVEGGDHCLEGVAGSGKYHEVSCRDELIGAAGGGHGVIRGSAVTAATGAAAGQTG